MTYLNGIDVSKWQPTTPSLVGLSFAFARATYATTVDPKYAMHVANFRRAGIVVGAYHFGVGHKPIHEQVRTFLHAAKGADLFILDLERDSTQTMTQAEAREFIRLVRAAGKKIGLYHSRSGFPELGQNYNWVAQWRKEPPTGIKWAFWQWQGSPLDRDKFNGAKAQLLALAGRAPTPIPAPPKEEPVAHPDAKLELLEANVAKIQGYVDTYLALRKRTARQGAALAINLDTLARNQRTLAAYREAHPDLPEVVAVDIGPDPLPNNALPPDTTYGADMTREEFEAKYGRSPEQVYSEVATGILRPNLAQWDALVTSSGGTFDQAQANYYKRGWVLKQKALIDYFAGKVPFSAVAGYFGGWYRNLGLVDISAIRDLGA